MPTKEEQHSEALRITTYQQTMWANLTMKFTTPIYGQHPPTLHYKDFINACLQHQRQSLFPIPTIIAIGRTIGTQ